MGDLTVEHAGKAAVVASAGVEWAQYFSADGNVFLFSIKGWNYVGRSDGTVVPNLAMFPGDHEIVGRWLYYHRQLSDGSWQLFRRIAPDGPPQLIATGDPSTTSRGIFHQVSADGEAYWTCAASATTCQLVLPDAAGPIAVPKNMYGPVFSPDDKWAVIGCLLVGSNGAMRDLGCKIDVISAAFSEDSQTLVGGVGGIARVITPATGAVRILPAAPEPLVSVTVTPNGQRVVGFSGNRHVFVARASGGDWTTLTTDPYSVRGAPDFPTGVSISPDSRVIAATSISRGVVEAVDGVDSVKVVQHDGRPMLYATPVFEPAGGRGRAIFYENDTSPTYHLVIGNADGSGDWVEVPDWPGFARWTGHSVLVYVASASTPGTYDLFVTLSTGERRLLASGVATWFVTESVDRPVLLYTSSAGALYSIPVPQPAP